MTSLLEPPTTPVDAALHAVREAINTLVAVTSGGGDDLWRLTGPQLLEAAAALHRTHNRADAVMHLLVREVDARGAAVEAGAPNTAGWLRGRLLLHPGSAKRMVTTARALHDTPAGPLVDHHGPEQDSDLAASGLDDGARGQGLWRLRAAFASGEISAEHATVAARTMATLPTDTNPGIRDQAETFLADHAAIHDPRSLAHLGRHLQHRLDPNAGDTLADEDEAARARQTLEIRRRDDGGSSVRGTFGPELTAALLAALTPLAAPRAGTGDQRDQRTVGQRNADALAELLRRHAAAGHAQTRHGSRATVTITMALDTLQRRCGAPGATFDWTGPVSAETARRLACDARIIPVVLGSAGEPLDVGRASYPVTQAIWRALVARDGGCAFAGCDRPPEWTEAHHRTHWGDGGDTSVANCTLLCDHHHRSVHHHGWDLDLVNGIIMTIPPRWIDPTRTPRPNLGPSRLQRSPDHDPP